MNEPVGSFEVAVVTLRSAKAAQWPPRSSAARGGGAVLRVLQVAVSLASTKEGTPYGESEPAARPAAPAAPTAFWPHWTVCLRVPCCSWVCLLPSPSALCLGAPLDPRRLLARALLAGLSQPVAAPLRSVTGRASGLRAAG